jgi:hypothetical protein
MPVSTNLIYSLGGLQHEESLIAANLLTLSVVSNPAFLADTSLGVIE